VEGLAEGYGEEGGGGEVQTSEEGVVVWMEVECVELEDFVFYVLA
jgi:hypothetical protein